MRGRILVRRFERGKEVNIYRKEMNHNGNIEKK
jgi:hypothetical protein